MRLAIIGATGVVGREVINCLHQLKFPVTQLRLVASEKSVGRSFTTPFGDIALETASEEIFRVSDLAIFCAGSEVSQALFPIAKKNNCLVIDNSSAFRYDPNVPLIIPEINPQSAYAHQGLIANPNCTTAIAAVVLWPLHQNFRLKKVIISTYQATSGAGKNGMDELMQQTRDYLDGKSESIIYFPHHIAFNIIPQIDNFQENGYTREEMKVVWETHKIFGDDSIQISCTAVRIPTLRAHSESISIETEKPISPTLARKILLDAPGVTIVDNPQQKEYPMPRYISEKFNVAVGRIRQSLVFAEHGLEFFVSGDQLLKGAALNAVQIAQLFTQPVKELLLQA